MKRFLLLLIIVVAVLAIILVSRAGLVPSRLVAGEPYAFKPDTGILAREMSRAIQYRTISFGDGRPVNAAAFRGLHRHLAESFPLVHATLTVERVNDYSLLYHWRGRSPQGKKPVLLLGHMDVVPVATGTEGDWKEPPFDGVITDTHIWGRGSLDNKLNVISILSAAEHMLRAGIAPERDIYFAFGHDEEVGGSRGAGEIAKLLASRKLSFEFLLDEGGVLARDLVPGIDVPVALIAPSEKGYIDLSLSTRATGGHSSAPPEQTAIGILAAAIAQLEANQFPRDFRHTRIFLESIADRLPFLQRIIMKNLWLFRPLVMRSFIGDSGQEATMRTTIATTIIRGGVKSNVLPTEAEAIINFRILPGETPESVRSRVIEVIADERISVEFERDGFVGGLPSRVSPLSGFGWEQTSAAIADIVAPDVILIAPRILIAATDTRHYIEVCDNHYRFTWIELTPETLGLVHGTNERVKIGALVNAVRFFHRLMSAL